MTHRELSWKSNDGLQLYAQSWEPPVVAPRAVVCLVHGLGEHSSRYAHVAEAFGREGYVLIGADHRGHGRSAGRRGHITSINDFMGDIDILLEQARTLYPGLPMILYGHSLGGILVLHYALTHKPDLKGVIATSSGLHNALQKQPLKILMAKVLGVVMPGTLIASGLDNQGISRDPNVIEAYLKDPLVHHRVSLGLGKIMLGVIPWTMEHASEFQYPLLLIHGKKDPIAYPSGSIEFAAAAKERSTLVLWDEGFHELQNDPDKLEVIKTMTMWMNARLNEG